jgi:hypothetical protein
MLISFHTEQGHVETYKMVPPYYACSRHTVSTCVLQL